MPRDLFKVAEIDVKPAFHATVPVGTAAEGAAIKEGSHLVHEGVLVQVIGGERQAVAVRDGKAFAKAGLEARQPAGDFGDPAALLGKLHLEAPERRLQAGDKAERGHVLFVSDGASDDLRARSSLSSISSTPPGHRADERLAVAAVSTLLSAAVARPAPF